MASQFGSASIESVTPIQGRPDTMTVRLEGKGVLEVHKDALERAEHGKTFAFSTLPFETTYEKNRREREEERAESAVRITTLG